MSRDQAVTNAQDFCKQNDKEVTYNQGSVNELKMSIRMLQDDKKGSTNAPECVGRFTNIVIDGCDGNDSINNPHNYKFGSTYTSPDGWEYAMQPLSKQVKEISCDVAYKFALDYFEIRGKNLPDTKFGAIGGGLKTQLSGCGAITK
ncbi:esterase family protein [Rutstroemia sp. NJR-2017a BVV2]|nr:esterase family protein [Rutstroemia sp. NJR-2017a BVV2]